MFQTRLLVVAVGCLSLAATRCSDSGLPGVSDASDSQIPDSTAADAGVVASDTAQAVSPHLVWQIDDLDQGEHFGAIAAEVAISGTGSEVMVGWFLNTDRLDCLGPDSAKIRWTHDLTQPVEQKLQYVGTSLDGALIVAATEVAVMGFGPDDAKPIWKIEPTGYFVKNAAVARGGSAVAVFTLDTQSSSHQVTLYDGATGAKQWDHPVPYNLTSSTPGISRIAISDDGKVVALSIDTELHVLDSGQVRLKESVEGKIVKLALSGDAALLFQTEGVSSMRSRKWNGATYADVWTGKIPCSQSFCDIGALAVSRDGSTIAVGSNEPGSAGGGSLLIYDAQGSGNPVVETKNLGGNVASIALSGDGAVCAVGSWGDKDNKANDLFVIDRDSGGVLFDLSTPGSVLGVAISDDGRYVVAGAKHVHAMAMGRQGHAYLVDTGVAP